MITYLFNLSYLVLPLDLAHLDPKLLYLHHCKYTQYANWEINLQRCHKILISDYENNHSLYTAAPSPQKKKLLRGGGGCTQAELIRFQANQGRKQ